ncbi:unnamed protein product [Rhizoctonia solani]|uniref:Uncharacterized protein n=1 Tax=Rhizoctonia solani TaxID=456999 RepID=A0A8H3GXU2_9AGAM|nr:unnamed protein product [Rhizoctonia solani]
MIQSQFTPLIVNLGVKTGYSIDPEKRATELSGFIATIVRVKTKSTYESVSSLPIATQPQVVVEASENIPPLPPPSPPPPVPAVVAPTPQPVNLVPLIQSLRGIRGVLIASGHVH